VGFLFADILFLNYAAFSQKESPHAFSSVEGNEGFITFKGELQKDGTITGDCKYPCCACIFAAYK